MRLIETEMLEAIKHGRDWSKDNTRVIQTHVGVVKVLLHGHEIAQVSRQGGVVVNVSTLRDWPTRTTMSRLRALGVDVCTRKGEVMVYGEPL